MPDQQTINIALATLNIVSFALFGIDKTLARTTRGKRISEQTLLLIAAIFASLGALFAMVIFNHKTAKAKFRFSIPAFVFVHTLILGWLDYL